MPLCGMEPSLRHGGSDGASVCGMGDLMEHSCGMEDLMGPVWRICWMPLCGMEAFIAAWRI